MALQYNLAKVYEISENDIEFALQIVTLFFEEVPAEIKARASELDAARAAKDFATADAIRNELQAGGWLVETSKEGTRVRRA